MILVEIKEDVFNNALVKTDEAMWHLKKSKAALRCVEDLLYELYESGESEDEGEYRKIQEFGDVAVSGNDIEVNYHDRGGMRSGNKETMSYRKSGMRRGSMGRYSY